VLTRSSKRPANVQHYICWKFAGRLLDRVNTLLVCWRTDQLASNNAVGITASVTTRLRARTRKPVRQKLNRVS